MVECLWFVCSAYAAVALSARALSTGAQGPRSSAPVRPNEEELRDHVCRRPWGEPDAVTSCRSCGTVNFEGGHLLAAMLCLGSHVWQADLHHSPYVPAGMWINNHNKIIT